MVMHVCAIPVRRVRQGTFYLHCSACHGAHKAPKSGMINPHKIKAPQDYEPLTSQTGSPLIAASKVPVFSTTTRRSSSGWAPQLAPVLEGSGKGPRKSL